MARIFKISFSILAVIALFIILAALILPLIINPNDFKPQIQSAVKNSLGRELVIDGDLELSVFPWIGLSTGKLTLSNAEGFAAKYFAEIEESNVKVKLLPLLSKKLEVNRIVLKGLVLNLAKNKQGISNWDDLAGQKKVEDKKQQPTDVSSGTKQSDASPLAALAIGGISIEKAQVIWDDQQQGKYTEINNFNLNTDQLVFDQPISIELALTVLSKEPQITETLSFSTDLIINEKLDVIQLKKLVLDTLTKGKDIPEKGVGARLTAEVGLDLGLQTLNISALKLNADELALTAEISGTAIKDKPVFKGPIKIAAFNLAQFMTNLGKPLPAMQDAKALTKLALAFDLSASATDADIKNLNITLDDTKIAGSSSIKNFAKPAITFDFTVDDIDVDRYLAPVSKDKKAKTVASPATAAAATASLFPVETLRDLNVNGALKVDKLKVNNLNMQGLSLKLKANNGQITTEQAVKQFYQGAYSGNMGLNVKNKTPVLSLNEKLAGVSVEPLLKDFNEQSARMSGEVNASAQLQARGNSTEAIKSTLDGQVDFKFSDGTIKGFNLQKMIDNVKALIEGAPLPTENKNDQTVFSLIKGTATINNGLVSNKDLYAESSKLRVNGKGTANLVSEKLDYKVNAKLLKRVGTDTEEEKIKGVPLVLNVGGTLSKPSYTLDIPAMLMEKNKEKIEKKKDELLKKLDDKIGPGVGNLLKGLF